jgi:Flp pilus assembly protein TadD
MNRNVYATGSILFAAAAVIGASVFMPKASALSVDEQKMVYESYALEAQKNIAGATDKMVKVLDAAPNDYVANYRLGYLFSLEKKYANAAERYKKAAAVSPKSLEPWLALSLMGLYALDDDMVISGSQEILKRQPGNYFGLARLASAEIRRKNYQSALNHAKEGAALFPTDALFAEQVAAAYKDLGKMAEARAAVQTLLLLSPSNLYAKDFLAHDTK